MQHGSRPSHAGIGGGPSRHSGRPPHHRAPSPHGRPAVLAFRCEEATIPPRLSSMLDASSYSNSTCCSGQPRQSNCTRPENQATVQQSNCTSQTRFLSCTAMCRLKQCPPLLHSAVRTFWLVYRWKSCPSDRWGECARQKP